MIALYDTVTLHRDTTPLCTLIVTFESSKQLSKNAEVRQSFTRLSCQMAIYTPHNKTHDQPRWLHWLASHFLPNWTIRRHHDQSCFMHFLIRLLQITKKKYKYTIMQIIIILVNTQSTEVHTAALLPTKLISPFILSIVPHKSTSKS
jgi:hypothetical protein